MPGAPDVRGDGGGPVERLGERRRLVANLDCEDRWAGRASPRGRPVWGAAALRMLAPARPGDELWLPEGLRDRAAEQACRARGVVLVGGDPRAGDVAVALLPWAATEGVAEAGDAAYGDRSSESVSEVASGRVDVDVAPARGVVDALRSAAVPSARVARVANDRRTWCAWARKTGRAAAGARVVASESALGEHLRDGGATESPTGSWVLKSPWSTAGRDRLRGSWDGRADGLPAQDRTRLERLLSTSGELVFEPWFDVVAELGAAAVLSSRAGGARLAMLGLHVQTVSGGGTPATQTPIGREPPAGVSEAHLDELRAAVVDVAVELALRGYRGPFGVDAFVHRQPGGELALRAVSEVNARLTLGALAHAERARRGPGQRHPPS